MEGQLKLRLVVLAFVACPLVAAAGASLRADSGAATNGSQQQQEQNKDVPLHPEAQTVGSWVFLKSSMDLIRKQVQHLLDVKDDVLSMRQDLQIQEDVWKTSEGDLKHEIGQLAEKLQTLRQQVNAGESTWHKVQERRQSLAEAKAHNDRLQLEAHHEKSRIDMEHSFLTARRQNLSALVTAIDANIEKQVMQANDRQLKLETDGVALQIKATELKQRLNNSQRELEQKKLTASAEIQDVQRQLSGMHDGLTRLQHSLNSSTSIEAQKGELAKVSLELEQEVALMVSVQQEQADTVAECKRMHTVRSDALSSEQKKAELRKGEAKELCDPVRGQIVALRQMLEECRLNANANVIPSGLA